MGLQMGFTKNEIRYMYFSEWSDLFDEYKKIYNFEVKKMLFRTEEEKVSMLDM